MTKKHRAQLVEEVVAGEMKLSPALRCLTSKKAVGTLPSKVGSPTPQQLLEALDLSCRGKGDEDLGLHELVKNAV